MSGEKDFTVIEWKYINCIRGKLVNLPDPSKPIFFQVNGHYLAGYFYSEEDEQGFCINSGDCTQDDLVLIEDVARWAYVK